MVYCRERGEIAVKYNIDYEPTKESMEFKKKVILGAALLGCLTIMMPWLSMTAVLEDAIEDIAPLGILNLPGMISALRKLPQFIKSGLPLVLMVAVMFVLNVWCIVRILKRQEGYGVPMLASAFDILSWLGTKVICRLLNIQARNVLGEELEDYVDSSQVNTRLLNEGYATRVVLIAAFFMALMIYRLRKEEQRSRPEWIMDKKNKKE